MDYSTAMGQDLFTTKEPLKAWRYSILSGEGASSQTKISKGLVPCFQQNLGSSGIETLLHAHRFLAGAVISGMSPCFKHQLVHLLRLGFGTEMAQKKHHIIPHRPVHLVLGCGVVSLCSIKYLITPWNLVSRSNFSSLFKQQSAEVSIFVTLFT